MSLPSCITLRTVKGSVLSWAELDNNFICLNNSIENLSNSLLKNGNMWHIPSGYTLTLESDYQHFIYGDMVVEGLIQLSGDSQLVVLNGDLIFSGGSVVGTGTVYNIQLPDFDTKVTGLTYSGDVLTIYQNDGTSYSATVVTSTDVTVTGGTYDPNTGVATFYNNVGGNFPVTGFLTGYTDVQVSNLSYVGQTLVLNQTNGSSFSANTPMFSGNTSGDCITDLFVKNLNSCSPLRIQNVSNGDVLIGENGGVNVGIGTSTPTAKLHLSGTTPFISENTTDGTSTGLIIRSSDGGFDSGQELRLDFQQQTSLIGRMSSTFFGSQEFGFKFYGLNTSGFLNDLITFRGSGNVGIGTSTPTEKLEVSGNTKLSSLSNVFKISSYTALGMSQGVGAANVFIGGGVVTDGSNGGGISIGPSSTSFGDGVSIGQTAKADSTGGDSIAIGRNSTANGTVRSVAIGRNATSSASNAWALGYNATANQDNTFIFGDSSDINIKSGFGTNAPEARIHIKGSDSSSSNFGLKVQNSGGTDNFVVRNDGNVGIGTSTPTAKLEVKSNSSTGNTMYPFSVTNYPGSNVFYLSNQNYYGVDPNNLGVYSYIYDNQFNIELAGSAGQFKLNRGVNKFWMNPYPNALGINLLVESSVGGGGAAEAGIRHVFTSTSGGGTIYGESLYVGTDPSTGNTTIVGKYIAKSNFTNPNATFYPLIVMDGNMGIGTSTPTSKLQIKDETNSGIPRLQINTYTGNGGANNKGLYVTGNIDSSSDILCLLEHTNFAGGGGNGKIFKATGGNGGNKTTFDIEDKGYVRIGDTGITSNSAVHIKWTPNNFVPNSNVGNQDTFGLNIEHLYEVSGQSSNKYGLKIDSTGYYQPANTSYKNYGIFVNTDTGVGTGTTYAAVFNGGNVGIGTSVPSEKLHVVGNTKITGGLNIGTIGSGSPLINLGLDSLGNVVIGTTGGGGGIFTGGTISGPTNFTNGLTANTLTIGTFSVGRKFSSSESFTGSVTKTVTHNLNTQDVIVQLWDSSNNLLNGATIVANNVNSVDITVSSTATYKVVIIG